MAVRARVLNPTPSDRARQDRIMRAKQHRSPVDRTSNYHERLSEFARERDVPAFAVILEWEERAAVREYLGGVTRDEAEALAFNDTRERFAK